MNENKIPVGKVYDNSHMTISLPIKPEFLTADMSDLVESTLDFWLLKVKAESKFGEYQGKETILTTIVPKLLHGEEKDVNGDSGYVGAEKREGAIIRNKQGKKIKYKINRKPSQIKKLSKSGQYAAKKAEHKKSSVRAKVEHVFAVVKRLFGYRKTRYRGLLKQTAKLNIMFALANLYLADRKSLSV